MVTTAFSMLKAGRKRSLLLHHLSTHATAMAEVRCAHITHYELNWCILEVYHLQGWPFSMAY